MSKPFDPTKPVTMRDGTKAHIVAILNNDVYPILAVYESDGKESADTFTIDGKISSWDDEDSASDLVNVPEQVTVFLNFMKDGSIYPHPTKDKAELSATSKSNYSAIAVEVTYEVK